MDDLVRNGIVGRLPIVIEQSEHLLTYDHHVWLTNMSVFPMFFEKMDAEVAKSKRNPVQPFDIFDHAHSSIAEAMIILVLGKVGGPLLSACRILYRHRHLGVRQWTQPESNNHGRRRHCQRDRTVSKYVGICAFFPFALAWACLVNMHPSRCYLWVRTDIREGSILYSLGFASIFSAYSPLKYGKSCAIGDGKGRDP